MQPALAIDVLVAFSREVSEGEVSARSVMDRLAVALGGLNEVSGVMVLEMTAAGGPEIAASVGLSLAQPLSIVSLDEELERAVAAAVGAPTGCVLTLPLVSAGGLFGAVVLLWEGLDPNPVELRLAEGLIDLAAVAVDRAHRTQTLSETLAELRESKETLARREKLEALGEMAAVVAHEVKNPLASISGALQVLGQRMSTDSTEGKIVDMVVQRLRDLSAMVDELLLFARPRSPSLTRLPVRRLLDGVCGLFEANPKWSEISLRVRIEPTDAEIMADGAQLQGVLLNLLLNSAQACEGRGQIVISAERHRERAVLSVRDFGSGVPVELRSRIFDPFVTSKTRGSGLGLAVARQVIEAHGGSIRLESPSDGGARFVIELPA